MDVYICEFVQCRCSTYVHVQTHKGKSHYLCLNRLHWSELLICRHTDPLFLYLSVSRVKGMRALVVLTGKKIVNENKLT